MEDGQCDFYSVIAYFLRILPMDRLCTILGTGIKTTNDLIQCLLPLRSLCNLFHL